ncbi:MAG: hypothetical protein K6D94_09280, partial [Clostridiales bacterium]|nr:hypothetical protein [Clostridiales bacterium]
MEKVRVAIVGNGGIGNYHFSHLVNFSDVELVGFADPVTSKAVDMKNKAGLDGVDEGAIFGDALVLLTGELLVGVGGAEA